MKKFFAILLLTTLFVGCTKRAFDESEKMAKVTVSFQWSKLPNWDSPSDSMKLYFYGEDGRVFIKNATSKGFSGMLPAQNYDILAFNTDTKGMVYRNLEDYLTACAIAAPAETKAGDIIVQPERVYGISLGNVTFEPDLSQSFVLSPVEYSKKANIKFNFSGEVSSIKNCQVRLTGISKGLTLHNGELLSGKADAASLIVDNVNSSDFDVSVNLFGIASENNDSELTLNFTFEDNTTKDVKVDVSDALKNVIVGVNVTVFVDILKEAEGGFNAKLKSWVSTTENIGLK